MSPTRVRPATAEDRDFMFDQAPRLAAAAKLPWHVEGDLLRFQHRYMKASFALPESQAASFVAESQAGLLGFVHVEASTDSVTREPCAYIAVLAVAESAQGHSVGSRLMEAVETWARQRGFRLIELDVFANNQRARSFYARHGYQEDSLRLTKPLSKR